MIRAYILFSIIFSMGVQPVLAGEEFRIPAEPPKSHYRIEAKIDIDRSLIEGKATITLPNPTSFPLEVVAFDWAIKEGRSLVLSMGGKPLTLKDVTDSGMTHSQYSMYIDRKWVEERLKVPFTLKK